MKNILFLLMILSLFTNAYTIGDRVWNDSNQNWEQDAGEKGFANVTVELYADNGQKLKTTKTNNQGKYNFSNVDEGDYIVKVIPPHGTELITSNNLEKWVEKDRTDADFGLYIPNGNNKSYTVGDRVWNDKNQNWEQDAGEAGVVNVTVELYKENGQKVQSTKTDSKGKYSFTNVAKDDYIVKVTPPQGYELITSNNLEKWVDKDRNDADFGLYKGGNNNEGYSLGDRVWNDKDENWEQDAGEDGIANVTVELYTDKGQKVQSTTTNSKGKYAFKNIVIGDYIVKVVPPQGYQLVTSNNIEKWLDKDRTDADFGLLKGGNGGDATPPVITLNGKRTVRLKIGDDYNEEGATATDNVDGDVSAKIKIKSNVDTSKKGTYKVIYSVSDVAGNSASETRTVIVTKKIVKPPVNSTVTINEVLAANASTNLDPDFKEYSGWIELYNHTDKTIDLGGYGLSDNKNDLQKWEIPLGTKIKAKAYLLIWTDKEYDEIKALHTNFKLSYKGEELTLSDPDEKIVDSIKFFKQKGDISCAREENKIVYMEPTPNKPNGKKYTTSKRSKQPTFSLSSGFYNGAKTVKLSQKNGGDIYYTTDGSIPTESSKKYSSAISIKKTTVIRAVGFENGKFRSEVSNSTYLINENITLPVVSIGINDEYLNDNDIGIYKNYTERWMRTGSIEYIKGGKSKFSENVGIRIFGGQTRPFAQKSLAIFAKARFGAKSIKYKLFPDKTFIKKVKSFVLRNSGNDWGYTMMKDGLVHNIVKDKMNLDYQSYQPTVVFINGKYWGIHNIREKTNEDYVEANHGVDSKKIDLLEGQNEANGGSNNAYLDLVDYIKNNSLANNSNYDYVKSKIDIEEYINYMITELYVGNIDWPYNNIKYWREQKDTAKWRWILYDTDDSFDDVNLDSIKMALEINGPSEPNPPWATFLFRSLIKNSTFKSQFISTFKTHLNTTFKPSRIDGIITNMKNSIKPEIQRHFNKWQRRSPKDWETGSSDSIRALREFSADRADVMRALLSKHFK